MLVDEEEDDDDRSPGRYGRCEVVVDESNADIGSLFVRRSIDGGRDAGKLEVVAGAEIVLDISATPGSTERAVGALGSSPSSSSSSAGAL